MDTPKLESLYRRWLTEVWGQGRTDAARELMAKDLIDHNPYPGQPPGLEGHDWGAADATCRPGPAQRTLPRQLPSVQ